MTDSDFGSGLFGKKSAKTNDNAASQAEEAPIAPKAASAEPDAASSDSSSSSDAASASETPKKATKKKSRTTQKKAAKKSTTRKRKPKAEDDSADEAVPSDATAEAAVESGVSGDDAPRDAEPEDAAVPAPAAESEDDASSTDDSDEADGEDAAEKPRRRARGKRSRRAGGRAEKSSDEEREDVEEEDDDRPRSSDEDDTDDDEGEGRERRSRRRRGRRGRRDREGTTAAQDSTPRSILPKRHTSTQRVAVLVDCDSLDRALDARGDSKLAPIGLLELTTDGRPRTRAIAYLAVESRSRIEVLRGAGFDTVHIVPDEQERVVQIALDAVAAARRADTVVLASENKSLAPLAAHLRALGVRCEFASFDGEAYAATESSGSTLLELGADATLVP